MKFDEVIQAKIMELHKFFIKNEMPHIIGAINPEDEGNIHLSIMGDSRTAKEIYDTIRDAIEEEEESKGKAKNEPYL